MPAAQAFSKQALIDATGACALGQLDRFRAEAAALAEAAVSHEQAPSAETLLSVQQHWLSAMLLWQRAELFRFGPAAAPGEPGGRGLRDHIYAWNRNPPGNNRCRIEATLAERGYRGPEFETGLIVVRTLSALEFLAFHFAADTACTAFDDIVANGTWAALDEADLAQRRAEYVGVVAADVAARADALYRAWSPAGDDFLGTFTSPGNETFPTEQSVLDAVGAAFFYLDQDVKDYKLGMPLALVPECPKAACPEAFESQYARVSTLLLYENLNGFEELFAGCGPDPSALGFDDWLVAVGAEDLAGRMQEALDHAQEVVATLDPPLEDALLVDAAKVSAVHQAIKAVTDLLKTEFVTLLDLELPSAVATDND
jgi:predicted lipoprotein